MIPLSYLCVHIKLSVKTGTDIQRHDRGIGIESNETHIDRPQINSVASVPLVPTYRLAAVKTDSRPDP